MNTRHSRRISGGAATSNASRTFMSSLKQLFQWFFSHLLALALLTGALILCNALYDEWQLHKLSLDELQADLNLCRRTRDAVRGELGGLQKRLAALDAEIAAHPFTTLDRRWERKKLQLELDLKQQAYFKAAAAGQRIVGILDEKQQMFINRVAAAGRQYGLRYFVYCGLLLFAAPLLWALFMYYAVAALVARFPPLAIRNLPDNPRRPVARENGMAIEFRLGGKPLLLRSGDWGKKRCDAVAHTRFMWNWRYPLVSFAADLCELTAFTSRPGRDGRVTITSPYADWFIQQIDLNGSNGLVVRPRHLVGVTGDVKIRTRWSLNFHNLVSGRWRQIILHGEGSVFIAGSWGVEVTEPAPGDDHRIEDNLLLAYEAGAEYSLAPTETFWHYYRHQASLFDQKIVRGTFFTQNNNSAAPAGQKTPLERFVNIFLNGVGGLLGF